MTFMFHTPESPESGTLAVHLYILTLQGSLMVLLQICNVPDPPTGEEDATNTKQTGKQPHEHEHG